MLEASPVAYVGPAGHDLLRGGSELIDLSLLAARAAAAMRRLAQGVSVDSEDERVLDAMGGLLSEAAGSVEFFDSGGRAGSPPTGALAARVDAAIDAVLNERQQSTDSAALAEKLTQLAHRVRSAVSGADPVEANSLAQLLGDLARSVLRQTGHVGEVTTTL